MVFDISSLAVTAVLSLVLTVVVMYVSMKWYIAPQLESSLGKTMKDANNAISAAMSSLGKKSGESRQLKKMEKLMVNDILEQYPEIEAALEYFSPETAEMIREHPKRALIIMQRYKPLLDEFMGKASNEQPPTFDV